MTLFSAQACASPSRSGMLKPAFVISKIRSVIERSLTTALCAGLNRTVRFKRRFIPFVGRESGPDISSDGVLDTQRVLCIRNYPGTLMSKP
jgi:hypothetical protein